MSRFNLHTCYLFAENKNELDSIKVEDLPEYVNQLSYNGSDVGIFLDDQELQDRYGKLERKNDYLKISSNGLGGIDNNGLAISELFPSFIIYEIHDSESGYHRENIIKNSKVLRSITSEEDIVINIETKTYKDMENLYVNN